MRLCGSWRCMKPPGPGWKETPLLRRLGANYGFLLIEENTVRKNCLPSSSQHLPRFLPIPFPVCFVSLSCGGALTVTAA